MVTQLFLFCLTGAKIDIRQLMAAIMVTNYEGLQLTAN